MQVDDAVRLAQKHVQMHCQVPCLYSTDWQCDACRLDDAVRLAQKHM